MADITFDQQIAFLSQVVILSFGDPPPYENGQSRTDWIRNETNTQFSSLSETQRQQLIRLSNTIHNLTDARSERNLAIRLQEIENEKQKNINQQERNRIDSLNLKGNRKSASRLNVSEIGQMKAKEVNFYTSSTSKTSRSLRGLLNKAIQDLINQSRTKDLPEIDVRVVMDPFFINAATALDLPCAHQTEFYFEGERTFGNIDHVYCFGDTNIPVFLLEYKTTKKSVSSGIPQILGEVEGIFQNLRCILGNDAVELVGILTNGFEWIGVRSYFRDEQLILEYSTLISALTPHTTVRSIDTTGVNSILRLLSYCFDKVKNLMNSIENFNNRNKKRIFNDDEPPVSRDDEEDPEDPEDPENKSRKRSLRKPSSSTSLKKSKGNHSSKTSGQKSNKNQETEDFGTLSEWNIITHTRNPENVNEYRSLERFLGLEKVF